MGNYRLSEYDKARLDDQNRTNLPAVWIVCFGLATVGVWLLTRFLDWVG